MSEYSYLECTASCMQALSEVLRTWPHLLPSPLRLEAQRQIERGAQFIAERQEESGAWPGFWGVNYTYGTLFVVSGLLAANRPDSESAIERACEWLLAHRLPDGGWGEDIASCAEGHYIPLAHSQAIQTAWAMMTLLRAEYVTEKSRAALHEAAALLLAQQNPDGTWERGAGAGIFFNTAALHYDLYRLYFPMWALGLYAKAQHQGLL